jgi:hypothetical protein
MPPLLQGSHDSQVNLLALWYSGAAHAAYGKWPWTFRQGGTRSRWVHLLRKVAPLFVAEEIRPAVWCRFSMTVYQTYIKPGGKTPPKPSWVFSAKRIEGQRGWYSSYVSDYDGGCIVYTRSARALMRRQARLRQALAVEYPCNEEELQRVVGRTLTRPQQARLVDAIKSEAREVSADLRRQAEAGRWIW